MPNTPPNSPPFPPNQPKDSTFSCSENTTPSLDLDSHPQPSTLETLNPDHNQQEDPQIVSDDQEQEDPEPENEGMMNNPHSPLPNPSISDTHTALEVKCNPTVSPSVRRGGPKRKKGLAKNHKSQVALEKKLQTLSQNLKVIPFVPVKVLDFAQHEEYLKKLGLWEFAHIEFDRNLRADLIVQLVANYNPKSRGSYVNEYKIGVNRADLGRALKLPSAKRVAGDSDLEDYPVGFLSFLDEFISNWMLLHGDVWFTPTEVVTWLNLIKEKRPEKVDWAGLIWFMVEKELAQGPNLRSCYYGSHLQLLIKMQREDLLRENVKVELTVEDDEDGGDVKMLDVEESSLEGQKSEDRNVEVKVGEDSVALVDNAGKADSVEKVDDVDNKIGNEDDVHEGDSVNEVHKVENVERAEHVENIGIAVEQMRDDNIGDGHSKKADECIENTEKHIENSDEGIENAEKCVENSNVDTVNADGCMETGDKRLVNYQGIENADKCNENADECVGNADKHIENDGKHIENADQCIDFVDESVENADKHIENDDKHIENADQCIEFADECVENADNNIENADEPIEDVGRADEQDDNAEDSTEVSKDIDMISFGYCKGEEPAQWLSDGKDNGDQHFLQACSMSDVKTSSQERIQDGAGEDMEEDDHEEDGHVEGFRIMPKGRMDGMTSASFMHAFESVQLPFTSPELGGQSSLELLSSRTENNMILGGSTVFNHSGKRQIGLDHDISHHSLNDNHKKMRIESSWAPKPTDYDIAMQEMNRAFEKVKMALETDKAAFYHQESVNQQIMSQQIAEKDNEILQLGHKLNELQRRRQADINLRDRELYLMNSVIEGYRKALKQTQKEFAEFRRRHAIANEPIYKDAGSGGIVKSIMALEKERIKQEEEKKKICLLLEETYNNLMNEYVFKWEEFDAKVASLHSRVQNAAKEVETVKDCFVKCKSSGITENECNES